MMHLVSVIIPCYKSENYIRQCLDSLIAQRYENWEAIVVDDQPSEKMVSVMTNYILMDPRIRYHIRTEKGNPASARNYGLKYARGRYIAFLDSDDWWDKDKLEIVMDAFDEHPAVLWVAHYLTQHHSDREKHEFVYPGHDTAIGGVGAIVIDSFLIDGILKERRYVFDETLDRMDDAELILHIRDSGSHLVPMHLSYMRMREEGLTSNTSEWRRALIIARIGIKNRAYGLVAFHIALVLCLTVGIDPLKIKKAVFG